MEAGPALALIDGRYRPSRLLGEGTFARTWACQDLGEGQRTVALKELRFRGIGDWKPVELFEREARVLESLRHHGVPQIFRHFEGRDAEGNLCLYLAMELVEGRSLLEELRAGRRFSPLELTELTLSLLDILDYLHGRVPPVFHRDIKPSNVVLRASGSPVLIDFGGVCHGWRSPQGGSTVTGTFGYMPPEQLLGQVSPGSDLYALGATLLHLVTGREPTDFSYEAGRLSLPEDAAVGPALRRLTNALLAPAPRDRPPSARAARRMLMEDAEPRSLVPSARPSRALVPPADLPLAYEALPAGGRPETVDIGQPPRDPNGPHADVYKNLIEVFDGCHQAGRRKGAFGRASMEVLLAAATLGIWTIYRSSVYRRRRAKLEPLFRNGEATVGRMVQLTGVGFLDAQMTPTLTYEYQVGGQLYRSHMESTHSLDPHLKPGDPLTVLHDPADPRVSCVVYRWRTDVPPR